MTDERLKLTLMRSLAGQLANIRASARGLGLRRVRQSVTVRATPENRGMIRAAAHLLKVESDGGVNRAGGKGV